MKINIISQNFNNQNQEEQNIQNNSFSDENDSIYSDVQDAFLINEIQTKLKMQIWI